MKTKTFIFPWVFLGPKGTPVSMFCSASALRNQHMGFFLVAATSCWKLNSSWIFENTQPPVHLWISACWCRLRQFYIVYVYVHINVHGCKYIYNTVYQISYVYCVYTHLYTYIYIYLVFWLCPWSCGCCRAKLSISHIQCPRQWQWHLLVSPSATTWLSSRLPRGICRNNPWELVNMMCG